MKRKTPSAARLLELEARRLEDSAYGVANSDHDHYQKEVKRSNLIGLFLQGVEIDKYITTHLYGDVRRYGDDNGLERTLDTSIQLNDLFGQATIQSMLIERDAAVDESMCWLAQRRLVAKEAGKIKKMTAFQTYIALVKGYCGACVLFTPKAFANGGYIFSSISMVLAGILTTVSAVKLIQVGQQMNCFSYS